MTATTDLLGQLRREWHRAGRTREARSSLERVREHHPGVALEGRHDLCDVVDALEIRGGLSAVERAEVVRALLIEAGDPLVHRTLLQTLLPGIVSVCRQLRFGNGIIDDPSETLGMALSLASELLSDWAGQSRQYCAPDILSALRGRLRRWLLKEKAARRTVSAYDQADEPSAMPSPLLARLESYRGGQYDRIAKITYARVFEGRSLRELAHDDHSAPSSLQAELQHFAIRFLV
ncbi:MAG: hypothetical protein ABSC34_12015 [Acidimicrobiales bacterium]|jgi:hypothetical protein